jgi:hypothetical protein
LNRIHPKAQFVVKADHYLSSSTKFVIFICHRSGFRALSALNTPIGRNADEHRQADGNSLILWDAPPTRRPFGANSSKHSGILI